MRYLVVGAGALGGYFGGRLLDAGCDVTFLLRPGRAAALARTGLVIRSPVGDLTIPSPPYVLADGIASAYDVVIVGCKAYDLAATMESFAPAVGPDTAILPMLNGMRHLDDLTARFGAGHVLGGLAVISAGLDAEGAVQHYNPLHGLVYGELDGTMSSRVEAIQSDFSKANFSGRPTAEVLQEMWEKWVMIASIAGTTCLMRATLGDVVAAGGTDVSLGLMTEAGAIAAANGFAPRAIAVERAGRALTAAGSPITASMLKDMERGGAVEADQIFGDLLSRAPTSGAGVVSLLRVVYVHLKAYEARRARLDQA